ncbi:MAG: hypothetical protein ABEI52_10950, partial [Halobacteriaceae archaeon]
MDQQPRAYAVTYAFNGYLRSEFPNAVACIRDTATELQRKGEEIEFLGATQVIDSEGQVRMVTARFKAPTKGFIGLLNCRAGLPACGPPQ